MQASLIDSLTQAFTSGKKTSPATAGRIAELVDSMLVGGFWTETVKERAEKHSSPENCRHLSVMTVKEKIWDLLSRKIRSVDLVSFPASSRTLVTVIVSLDKFGADEAPRACTA